jgi:peptide/nickel transport system substrate-binding protein
MKTLLKLKKIIILQKIIDIFIIILFLSGILSLIYYIKLTNKDEPKYGGFYKEGLFETITSLNPIIPTNESEATILNIIYPPLIEFDNGKIISKFIQNYYFSPDKLTLTLVLKELKWSNGSKITTDDLIFSFETFKKYGAPEIINNLKNIHIKALDQKRAEIQLPFNNNYFLFSLNNIKILPSKIFADLNINNFDKSVLKIGSGPFIFDSIENKGDIMIIKLVRNTFYNPKPYLDGVIFYVFPSAKSAFDALLSKEIDGLAGLNYLQFPNNFKFHYQFYKINLPRIIGIFFNSQKVDSNIVEQLDNLINRQKIVNDVLKNNAEISYGIFSPKIREIFHISSTANYLTTKKTILKNNKNDIKLTILIPTSYFYPEIGRFLKENYSLNIEFIAPENLNQILTDKNYQAILTGLNYNQPPNLSAFFSKLGYNINNLNNLNLEKDLQELTNNPNIKINELLSKIEEKILSMKTNIFLCNPYYLYIINKQIKGFDQFYLNKSEDRLNKIASWYKK